ncbi:MAG: NAD-dependent epimerase/dehydratase family protein [Anaerolineales bacterium]|nr:NAD-dependent epimerase/dehydratase family protein [Anaerolineales bacterium]
MAVERILVTGATGFLGHSLAAELAASGAVVRALVRPTSDVRQLQALGAELAPGDVTDAASLEAALAGCDAVIHAAGLFRLWGAAGDFERTNVHGTANVLEAAGRLQVKRLVHISTLAVIGYPPAGQTLTEATPCRPADAYQRSKLAGEDLVREYQRATGLPAVILRPGAFYGPWGRYAFNRLFFEDPLKGLLIQVHNGRRMTFPAFVPDVARVCVAALRAGRPGAVYNVSGASLTHAEVNRTISCLAGLPAFRLNVPAAAMLALARWSTHRAERTGREPYYPLNLANYVFHDWRVSSALAESDLGFRATPFEAGARQTLEWYWSAGLYRRRGARPIG